MESPSVGQNPSPVPTAESPAIGQLRAALVKRELETQQAQAEQLLKLLQGKGRVIDIRV